MEVLNPHHLVNRTGPATSAGPASALATMRCDRACRDYPARGIPHYLIVDPRDGTRTYQWQVKTGGLPLYPRTDVTLAPV